MLFVFIYTFLCNRNHPKRKEEMEQQIPFSYVIISPENATEKEGYMISTIDKCGFFFCQKGEVEVALNDKSYLISKGSVCIYMTGSLLRIQRISKDIKGIMLEVDLNYIIPIVNKIVNSENLLYLRENPCFSITEYQYNYLEQLIKALQQRMDIKAHDIPLQRQHLISELIKSWGQTLCYELPTSNQAQKILQRSDFLSSATPFFKKQTIDSPASQYTPYRTSQGKQECLTTQRGKIIDNILIRTDRYSQKEKKQKDRIRNRFADLLQKFDFAQKIACGNTREHNTNDSKHR